MTNAQLDEYIARERSNGVSDSKIRQELLAKRWDPILVHRALNSVPDSVEKPVFHLNGSTALLIVGLSLIFIAAFVYFGYSWPDLSPLSRFTLIAVPNLLLFLIGSYMAKGEQLLTIKEGTHTTGLMILPISIGVFLYQFGLYDKIDSLLMAYSVLIAFPLYLFSAIYKKHDYGNVLVVIGAIAIAVFLMADNTLDGWESSGLLTVVSILTLLTAYQRKKDGRDQYLPVLISTGTVLFLASFPFLIGAVFGQLISDQSLNSIIEAIVAGGGLLVAAGLFGALFKPWTRTELSHQRLMIFIGTIIAFTSLVGGNGDGVVLSIVSVLFSTLVVIIGLGAQSKFTTWLGLIGGTLSLLNLLFGSVDKVSLVVAMFVLGFGAILLSIFFAKRSHQSEKLSPAAYFHMGYIDDQTASTLQVNTGEAPTLLVVLARIALVIILFWFIMFAFSHTNSTDPYYNSSHHPSSNSFI